MIRKYETRVIPTNMSGKTGEINGEILKVIIQISKPMPMLSVLIHTDVGERVLEIEGMDRTDIFYPVNELAFDGKIYNMSQMKFRVDGLEDGEKIDNIIIIYKGEN